MTELPAVNHPGTPCRVFVVEDHEVMREMLCEAVERQPGCRLSGAACSAEEALCALAECEVDLVLADVSLPHMSGVELVLELHKRMPDLPTLMVSGHIEAGYAEQALAAGARGYVLKGRPDDLADAIRTVLAGGTYLSEPVEEKLAR